MSLYDRHIVITDIETTGPNTTEHEIIEIGAVLIEQKTLKIIDTFESKVKPQHPQTATHKAIKTNGFNLSAWESAPTLKLVIRRYSKFTRNALFCAHNVSFDWKFIELAFDQTESNNLMDYHQVDLSTLSFELLRHKKLRNFSMNEVARYLGITPEPLPHRGINGARTEYQIYKKLRAVIAKNKNL